MTWPGSGRSAAAGLALCPRSLELVSLASGPPTDKIAVAKRVSGNVSETVLVVKVPIPEGTREVDIAAFLSWNTKIQ